MITYTMSEYVDVLTVDKPIAGQEFVCISFLSPEKILKMKELFYFERFLKTWDVSKSLERFHAFNQYVSYKYNISFEELDKDMREFVADQKESLNYSELYDDYRTFLDREEDKMEKEFNLKNEFQTAVRGIKVRGSFPTQEEAEFRCKILREADPNHDIFVGPVGVWMPWDPEAYKTGRVEYMEKELNDLMHEKMKNESQAKSEFDQRIAETKKKAMEENAANAAKSGASLTQTMDAEGNLVSTGLTEDVNNIKSGLFNTDDVIIPPKKE